MNKIKICNPFFCFFVLATYFWMTSGRKGPLFLFLSVTCIFLHLHSSVSLSWSGFVAPSWWRLTIKAQPERCVAVIHAFAEQTSLKGSTVPNISLGWSEYFRLPSYCPRHFIFPQVFFSSEELVFCFNLQRRGHKIQRSIQHSITWQILPKRESQTNKQKINKLNSHGLLLVAVPLLGTTRSNTAYISPP